MPIATRDLYRSANGDRWILIRDDYRAGLRASRGEPRFGRNRKPTPRSTSSWARMPLAEKKQELLRLIGSLAEYRITSGASAA